MAMTTSEVAAFLRTGAAPTVRLMPARTALTLSSDVGLVSLAARWKYLNSPVSFCLLRGRADGAVEGAVADV
jgi:hypothetical protein